MKANSKDIVWNMGEEEVFHFLHGGFDVKMAKQILTSKPRKLDQLPVQSVKAFLPEPGIMKFGVVSVDRVKAAQANLEIPVILVWVDGTYFPIDGWHRLYKAAQMGLEHMPCVRLNKTESKKVRCP